MRKRCTGCKKMRELKRDFYKNKRSRDGYYSQCKVCHKANVKRWADRNGDTIASYHKRWRAARPGYAAAHARRYRYMKKYGMTEAEVVELFEKQEGKCKICGLKPKKPHIDHCHKTGRVRGILCPACNKGLGHFKDDVQLLQAAVAYLET